MANPPRGIDDRRMTTEQPFDQPIDPARDARPGGPQAAIRRLRRRTGERVIGGVAGGLGDYLNVDPILLRAGFAGLMIFGGAGLVLYVLGWVLIPAEGQWDSIFQAAIRRVARRTGRVGLVLLIALTVFVVTPWVLNGYDGFYVPPEVFWALAVALIGIILLLPRDEPAGAGGMPGAMTSGTAGAYPAPSAEGGATGATASAWTRAAPRPKPREHSPLGWYALAGALILLGVLALVANVAGVRVLPGQYFGAGLLALGTGLLVGAWWGGARLLILLGLVLLPAAVVSAFLTVPLEGGLGEHYYAPRSITEIPAAYRVVGGRLDIDLTQLEAGDTPVAIEASMGIGDVYIVVPRDATVELTGSVQGGRLVLLTREHVGTDLSDHVVSAGEPGGAALTLTIDVGIGQVWIDRSNLLEDE